MGPFITSRAFCGALFVAATLCQSPAFGQVGQESIVSFLEGVQASSLEDNREYCGYLYRRADGAIRATRPRRGAVYYCAPRLPNAEIIASYHTHGRFSEDADSEVPSVDDILGDREEGIDGYITTPGGRVWFHDVEAGTVRQLCGLGCVTADPKHLDSYFLPVRGTYTLEDLERRFARYGTDVKQR